MYLIALIVSIFVVYFAVSKFYTHHTFDSVAYSATLSTEEVFEDEDIFLYEEITNGKILPLPCVRIDTDLPEGLQFRLHERDSNAADKDPHARPSGIKGEYTRGHVQSIFSLHSRRKIMRRWRVACQKRGSYSMSSVILVSTDPLGLNTQSKRVEITPGRRNRVTVLPKTIVLDEHFTSAYHINGDLTAPRGLLTDPIRIAGSRDYTPLDPMSKINWMSTASHGRLMVNVEEFAERKRFGLILNMQSRGREHNALMPSDPASVEMCITVCASVFDMMSHENIPVTMYVNAPLGEDNPETEIDIQACRIPVGDNPADNKDGEDFIFKTPAYTGRGDMLKALRLLAELPMKISCPTEKMLDAICASPHQYADGENIIMVSSYIDERMLIFHDIMRRNGIRVVFYITTANQNAVIIPDDVEVWFKIYR